MSVDLGLVMLSVLAAAGFLARRMLAARAARRGCGCGSTACGKLKVGA